MRGAERDGSGEIAERQRLFGGFDELACGDDFGGRGIGLLRLRTAALAGTESGTLGGIWVGKEFDAVTLRTAARARRAAVDSGGTNGVDKGAVETGVTGQDRLPLEILRHCLFPPMAHGRGWPLRSSIRALMSKPKALTTEDAEDTEVYFLFLPEAAFFGTAL